MGALLAGTVGCTYTPSTTVTVRDPSAVRVDVATEKGVETILPPGAQAAEAMLPSSSPPYTQGLHPPTSVRRLAGGPIEVRCAECSPAEQPLVPMDGTIALTGGLKVTEFDWTQKEMRIRFEDELDVSGNASVFEAEVATPWSNVARVKKTSTPDRPFGLKLLLSAGVAAVLGGFALGEGVSQRQPATIAFAGALIPVAVILGIGGGWYSLAPAKTQILYGN